jgi:ABC-type branched-subunit amino acid transport system substrate-binding protein
LQNKNGHEEINAAGGLLGKKIKILPQDSELQPDVAVRKATKAIGEDGAKIILQLSSEVEVRGWR